MRSTASQTSNSSALDGTPRADIGQMACTYSANVKRVCALFIICLIMLIAGFPAEAGVPLLVQSNAGQGAGIGSLSVPFSSSNTAGNLIVVFVRMSTTSQTVLVADTA